jgi:hypothetical protein
VNRRELLKLALAAPAAAVGVKLAGKKPYEAPRVYELGLAETYKKLRREVCRDDMHEFIEERRRRGELKTASLPWHRERWHV